MSLKKNNRSKKNKSPISDYDSKNKKRDVVDRFLSVLWRREVDLKLTTK